MNDACRCHKQSRTVTPPSGTCDLTVVIPVYRSEATLELLFQRLIPALDSLDRNYEVVLVEDGSPDNSWLVLQSLQKRFADRVVAVQLMRNSGQHNALMCGLRHARGTVVVTMDDDLQNPPEEISRLLQEIESSDSDLVYGQYGDKKHTAFRNVGSLITNSFYRSVFRTRTTVTSFRAIRRPLLNAILDYNQSFVFLDGLLAWNTQRVASVLVEHHPRQIGQSTYSFGKLLTLAINLFTSFSLIPLQFISLIGVLTLLSGFAVGAYSVLLTMAGGSISGFVLILTALFILGGVQLMAIGMIGEYTGRMHLHINGKPQYRERLVLKMVPVADQESTCNE